MFCFIFCKNNRISVEGLGQYHAYKPPVILAAVHSKAVVLLSLNHCVLLLLCIVGVLCLVFVFVTQYLVSFLIL